MLDAPHTFTWQLPNPFLRPRGAAPLLMDDSSREMLSGYVSGRLPEIRDIIVGRQSAFILSGAPHIGKSTLIHYLALSTQHWSWRNEFSPGIREQLKQAGIYPEHIHFVQVDLKPLESASRDTLLETFETQCILALQQVYQAKDKPLHTKLENTGLRETLRLLYAQQPDARYFVMLDSIERLGRLSLNTLSPENEGQPYRDRGLALLEEGSIIHELVELNEEFPNFGVLLAVESIPGPNAEHQFCHVNINLSNDLSRFETLTLSTLTWEDAERFVSQQPESGGTTWAQRFRQQHGEAIFTHEERAWLLEQAGTHLYLLQLCCFHAFDFKQKRATRQDIWPMLDEYNKKQLIEKIVERQAMFLLNLWKRVQEALEKSSQNTRTAFKEFLHAQGVFPNKEIDAKQWWSLGQELRYILTSEGVVSIDETERVRYPGAILLEYLYKSSLAETEATTTTEAPGSPLLSTNRGFWLRIQSPESIYDRVSLSEIEYRIFKALLEAPRNERTEEELMLAAWGTKVEKSPFSQRIHHLRKKLQKPLPHPDTEIIENAYGGRYILNHPEWFRLE